MFLHIIIVCLYVCLQAAKACSTRRFSLKSTTIRGSNHGLGVCKEHYAHYYRPKCSILLAGTGVWKISSVACGFSSFKIDYYDYLESLISRINEVMFFFQ